MENKLFDSLEATPIIAAVRDRLFGDAIESPVDVIFLLGGNLLTIEKRVQAAHEKGKMIFVHIDLAEGIGKDKTGIEFLKNTGVDGIISTKTAIIRMAREQGLYTVQRFFAYDSHGIEGIADMAAGASPDIIEIMPGVIWKIIKRFSALSIPLIAGGLIEEKSEVTEALALGALAVSTGKKELWYI